MMKSITVLSEHELQQKRKDSRKSWPFAQKSLRHTCTVNYNSDLEIVQNLEPTEHFLSLFQILQHCFGKLSVQNEKKKKSQSSPHCDLGRLDLTVFSWFRKPSDAFTDCTLYCVVGLILTGCYCFLNTLITHDEVKTCFMGFLKMNLLKNYSLFNESVQTHCCDPPDRAQVWSLWTSCLLYLTLRCV